MSPKNEATVKLYTDGSKILGASSPKYFYPRTSLRLTLPDANTLLTQFILHNLSGSYI
jgi:hypothetical protein